MMNLACLWHLVNIGNCANISSLMYIMRFYAQRIWPQRKSTTTKFLVWWDFKCHRHARFFRLVRFLGIFYVRPTCQLEILSPRYYIFVPTDECINDCRKNSNTLLFFSNRSPCSQSERYTPTHLPPRHLISFASSTFWGENGSRLVSLSVSKLIGAAALPNTPSPD